MDGIEVVIAGPVSDKVILQPHIRNKKKRKDLTGLSKDLNDALRLVTARRLLHKSGSSDCGHLEDKPAADKLERNLFHS